MPDPTGVIWATALGLIAIMLATIGYLVNKVGSMINKAFDNMKNDIKDELKTLWDKINAQHTLASANAAQILEHTGVDNERQRACQERHRRLDMEISNLQRRRSDDQNDGAE